MEIIDRKTAVENNLTTYYTGKECKNGHIALRNVGSGQCSECSKLLKRRWDKEGRTQCENMDKGKDLPDTVYLRELFTYREDGCLIWNKRPTRHFNNEGACKAFNTRYSGKVAGHYNKRNGYINVNLNNVYYKGHRLIYKLVTGIEPHLPVDHIDGDVSNNRIENLRLVTPQENAFNSNKRSERGKETSHFKGVQRVSSGWMTSLKKGDLVIKKTFENEIDAAKWYDVKALELFGSFAKPNFKEGVI